MRGLFGKLAGSVETKNIDGTTYGPPDLWLDLFGSRASATGISVTWKRALEVTTALRCAAIIAEGICSVPFLLYRRWLEGNLTKRAEARDHALFDLLAIAPNDWQTSFEFRETIGLHLALFQNAYVFVNRLSDGRIVELIPFEPQHVAREPLDGYRWQYRVTPTEGMPAQVFPQAAIWHIKGRSWNSFDGLATIKLAREALGLALATEESHARLHDKAVRPSGVLSVEGNLTEEQFKQWRRWVDAYYSGRENAGKALILDRSAKWQSQQMTGVDSQHLQTRGFQIEEVCRAMGVLPIMVGYTGDKSSTYASAEQMFLAHLSFTLRPWYERLQQSTDRWLLTQEDRAAGHYTDFSENALLRASLLDRATFWEKGVNNTLFTPNDARDDFGFDGLLGLDRPRMPLNMAIIGPDGVPVLPPRPGVPPVEMPSPAKDTING